MNISKAWLWAPISRGSPRGPYFSGMDPTSKHEDWHIKQLSSDERSWKKPTQTHRKSVVDGGLAAGNCRENVEPHFRKI